MKLSILLSFLTVTAFAQPNSGPVFIPFGNNSSGTVLPGDAAGALTNNGSGILGWLSLSSLGGGTTIPTNGSPGQALEIGSNGSVSMTNVDQIVGLFTNGPVLLFGQGDSLMTGFGSTDSKDPLYHLTNSFLPSNWSIATNGGVVGKPSTTMTNDMASIISKWGVTGTTNKVAIIWGPINDFLSTADAYQAFTNMNYCDWICKQSNMIVVAVTITASTGLNPTGRYAALDIFNKLRMSYSTNADYIVALHQSFPPPPDADWYNGGTHYISYKPVAEVIYQKLIRAKRSTFIPSLYTPKPSGLFNGSFTPYVGAYSLGCDIVIGGFGATPIFALGLPGAQLFTIYPNSSDRSVSFANNPAGSVYNNGGDDFLKARGRTNVFFPTTITAATNDALITTPSASVGSFTTNVAYTITGQRYLLRGAAVLTGVIGGSANITLWHTNAGTAYPLPMQQASVAGTGIFPFNEPMSPGDTFTFLGTYGSTASGYLTNVVQWKQ